VIKPVCLTKM